MLPDLAYVIQLIGYPGLFAVVFTESGIPFGFFLPGASLLFTAGFLASQGLLDIRILVPLLAIAAILGDNAGYWFGAKVGIKLFLRPNSRFFRHEHVVQAKDFYERHGVLAIVLARFVPIVRTFAPIVAGVAQMRYRLFVMYNVIGALLWGSGVTFLGFYLGEKVPFVSTYLTPIVILIIVITSIPIIWQAYKNLFKDVLKS